MLGPRRLRVGGQCYGPFAWTLSNEDENVNENVTKQ